MKNYLEHKGYLGTVDFSAEDKVFFGKIHGINDLITFEGTTVEELTSAFEEAVVDYLDTCKILNKNPDKVFKGSFNVRISQELHKKTSLLASKKGLNLNEVIKQALSYLVSHEEILKEEHV